MLSYLFDKLFKQVGVSGREITLNKIFNNNSFIIGNRINGEQFTDWKTGENEMDRGDDKCLVGV